MAKKMSPRMQKMHKVAKKLRTLKDKGVRKVKIFYTTKDGTANYRRIVITAALIAAAGTGIYMIRKHKKHGHVLHKKKKGKKKGKKR